MIRDWLQKRFSHFVNPTEADPISHQREKLDNITPVGIDRATRIAQFLDHKRREKNTSTFLIDMHRDYCGHGLFFADEKYMLAESRMDGWPTNVLKSWTDRDEFIKWISLRTDTEMSGEMGGIFGSPPSVYINNQRLSRERIDALLDHHDYRIGHPD